MVYVKEMGRELVFFCFLKFLWGKNERKRKKKECFKRVLQMLKGMVLELIFIFKKFSVNCFVDYNNVIL